MLARYGAPHRGQRWRSCGVGAKREKVERLSSGYLPLIIAATFLGKFGCQFEQRLGFLEVDGS